MRWLRAAQKPESASASALRTIRVRGVSLRVYDLAVSHASEVVRCELQADCYGVERIRFEPGDVVVDIGGHVGIFSIYLARRYPYIRVVAFEPTPLNYQHFVKNIEANRVTNVEVFNLAVTRDGRRLAMIAHRSNTGGATAQLRDMHLAEHDHYSVPSVTLDAIFAEHRIARCKLLKIDCEGSEHEILLSARCLDRVEYLSGEFHINDYLAGQGYSIERLVAHLQAIMPAERLHYTECRMAE